MALGGDRWVQVPLQWTQTADPAEEHCPSVHGEVRGSSKMELGNWVYPEGGQEQTPALVTLSRSKMALPGASSYPSSSKLSLPCSYRQTGASQCL